MFLRQGVCCCNNVDCTLEISLLLKREEKGLLQTVTTEISLLLDCSFAASTVTSENLRALANFSHPKMKLLRPIYIDFYWADIYIFSLFWLSRLHKIIYIYIFNLFIFVSGRHILWKSMYYLVFLLIALRSHVIRAARLGSHLSPFAWVSLGPLRPKLQLLVT